MLRHIVMLRWNRVLNEEEVATIARAFEALPSAVADIDAVVAGPDLRLDGDNCDFVAILDMADEGAWKRYQSHPAHRAFIRDYLAEVLGEKSAAQIEVVGR